jgi:hypothetical protein
MYQMLWRHEHCRQCTSVTYSMEQSPSWDAGQFSQLKCTS